MRVLLTVIFVLLLSVQSASASVYLTEEDFAAALRGEFAEQGRDEALELEFFGGQTSFALPTAEEAKILISHLKVWEDQGRFSAEAEIFADGTSQGKTSLFGKYYVQEEVWVPTEDIAKGTVIRSEQLKKIMMRGNRIKELHVTEAERLIGQEAKKTLKAGRLVAERDVGPKLLIKKGTIVTSVYRAKGLQITAQAVALEDGVKGQSIELENTKSGKKFSAVVVDAETVEINAEQ